MRMSKIAYNIKRLRTAKGITQEAFAKTVNVSRQAISSWETGRTQPDIEMIGTLADALGVSIEELIYGEKRNVKTDDTEKAYVSTATVVLSILGGLMLLAGAILILVWSWEHIPMVGKTVFAVVPMALGAAFAIYVLIKMNGDAFMEELSASAWVIGNWISLLFVNELFEYNLGGMKIGLLLIALTLPVLLTMKSMSALTFIYGTMAFVMNILWEYSAKSNILTIAIVTGALVIGVLFVTFYGKNLGCGRYRHSQAVTLLTTVYYIYEIFINYGGINPFVALLLVFAVCNILERDKDITDPIYLFGTVGSTVALHSYLITQGDLVGGSQKAEFPVLIASVLAFAFAWYVNRETLRQNTFKKLQSAILAAGAVVSAIHSAVYSMIPEEADSLTVKIHNASVYAVALLVFGFALVFIMQGLKENRLYSLNLGFVSIAVLAIILLTGLDADLLVKGCVLLLMGGILIFLNLKITNKKEKNKKLTESPSAETVGKTE